MKPVIFIHDGSFEGMLTAVARAVKSALHIQRITSTNDHIPQLFDCTEEIRTDTEQAERLFTYFKQLGSNTATLVLNAFLSEDQQVGTHLYHFTGLCLQHGNRALHMYTNDSVKHLQTLSRNVSFEAHRFEGLIRFRVLENDLQYAPFEPRHNIITFLAGHFRRRLATINWILHDISRDLAVYWDQENLKPIGMSEEITKSVRQHGELPDRMLTDDELNVQSLWRSFHKSIANDGRKNLKLQRQLMPQIYWKYLIEMKPDH